MNETNVALMERKAKALKDHVRGTSPTLPRGVKKGPNQGMQRHVFIDKRNGWVFKVERDSFMGKASNKSEIEAYIRGKDLEHFTDPKSRFRLPITMLVCDDVIVMEYVDGKYPNDVPYQDTSKLQTLLGIRDLHYGNMLVTKDGTVYVVDMGFSG